MTDDPTSGGSGESTFPSPSAVGGSGPSDGPRTAEPGPGVPERELRKGEDDARVLAGVCTGLGRYTGIDPVVWRAAFVLTAFAGSTGLLLYIAAWMLMRGSDGGPATFEQMLNRSIPPRAVPKLLAVGLVIATAFSLFGGLGWSTLVLAVPLVLGLLAARRQGVDLRSAFVQLREDLGSKEPPPSTPPPGPSPTYYNPAQPWVSAPQGPVDLAVVSERAAARADGDDEGDTEENGPEWGGGSPGHGPERSGNGCRTGAPLAALALWTIVAGGILVPLVTFGELSSLWSAQTAALLFGPETGVFFLSGVLAVIGLYALVGTWAGNPRGLMSLGLAAALVLALATVTDLTRTRIGLGTWRPTTVAEADSGDHRVTIGSGSLDLTGLEDLAPGDTVDVSLWVGAGRTELILPEDARVAVTSEVGLGVVDFARRGGDELVGFSLVYEEVHEPAVGAGAKAEGEEGPQDGGEAGPPLINVHTESLVGVVEVRHGEA